MFEPVARGVTAGALPFPLVGEVATWGGSSAPLVAIAAASLAARVADLERVPAEGVDAPAGRGRRRVQMDPCPSLGVSVDPSVGVVVGFALGGIVQRCPESLQRKHKALVRSKKM